MANFETHIKWGIAIALVTVLSYNILYPAEMFYTRIIESIIGFLLVAFASILPDIDEATSKARKIYLVLAFGSIITAILCKQEILAIIIAVLSALVICDLKHRGMLHSPLFGFFVGLIIMFFNMAFGIGFFMSFCSHIILDRGTKKNKFPY